MTIDSQIIKNIVDARGATDTVFRYEEKSLTREFVQTARAKIVEMNEVIHKCPDGIESGRGLWTYFCRSILNQCLPTADHEVSVDKGPVFVVFVADDYNRVPKEKAQTQRDRAKGRQTGIGEAGIDIAAAVITDDKLPPIAVIRSSPTLFYRTIIFLYRKILAMELSPDIHVFFSTPSPKTVTGEGLFRAQPTDLPMGANIGLRPSTEFPFPSHWQQGEGEVIAWCWARHLRQFFPQPETDRTVIISCDNDNFAICLLQPRGVSKNVFVKLVDKTLSHATVRAHLATRGVTTRHPRAHDDTMVTVDRYFDCNGIRTLFRGDPTATSVALMCILGGTDYCKGLPGIGPVTIAAHADRLIRDPLPLTGSGGEDDIDIIMSFITTLDTKKGKKRPSTDSHQPCAETAAWNIRYWKTCTNVE